MWKIWNNSWYGYNEILNESEFLIQDTSHDNNHNGSGKIKKTQNVSVFSIVAHKTPNIY